jgi:cellobiose-specific phosphotransferase system component IIA
MLPCNVVVRVGEAGTEVAMFDALSFAKSSESDAIREVADEASARLERALAAV